ncbi:MAG: hypothetical protein HKN04_01680 [Rhodothermaceae bacterium]|nr:hypothetical protein [Rhodothermaceae bacterium]
MVELPTLSAGQYSLVFNMLSFTIAATGAAFGALASVFEGGPEPLVGIAESWWWFALAGGGIGHGLARAEARDRHVVRAGSPSRP